MQAIAQQPCCSRLPTIAAPCKRSCHRHAAVACRRSLRRASHRTIAMLQPLADADCAVQAIAPQPRCSRLATSTAPRKRSRHSHAAAACRRPLRRAGHRATATLQPLADARCAVQAIAPQLRCGRLPTLTAPCKLSRHSRAAVACRRSLRRASHRTTATLQPLADARCSVQAYSPQLRCSRLPTPTAPCRPSRHSHAAAACRQSLRRASHRATATLQPLADAHCAMQAIAPQPRCSRLPTLTAPCKASRYSHAAAAC